MAFFVNELSLHGQYTTLADFEHAIADVLKMRHQANEKRVQYYCSTDLRGRFVSDGTTLNVASPKIGRKDLRVQLSRWLDVGTWALDRQHPEGDLFQLGDDEVSGKSIAEAAFRNRIGDNSALISFAPSAYMDQVLDVVRHENNGTVTPLPTRNYCDMPGFLSALEDAVAANRAATVTSWTGLIEWGQRHCPKLRFADYILDRLAGKSFYPIVSRRIIELLTVLDTLIQEREGDGRWTAKGAEIHAQYFVGHRPAFTDESEQNKVDHEVDLTFPHPDRPGEDLFCSFHGKVNNPVFRMHFSWPIVSNEPVYVVYIGQKLTKD